MQKLFAQIAVVNSLAVEDECLVVVIGLLLAVVLEKRAPLVSSALPFFWRVAG